MSWIPESSQTRSCLRYHSFSPCRLGDFPQLVAAMLDVKQAAARCNASVGAITTDQLQQILQAIGRLRDSQALVRDFPTDVYQGGGAIAINVNVNERIACEVDAAQWQHWVPVINRSQSTADACSTSVRLACARAAIVLQDSLQLLFKAFENKVAEFADVKTLARTCLRDAMPTTVGNKLRGFVHSTAASVAELHGLQERLRLVNLGGTVIGTSTGAAEAYVANILSELSVVAGLPLSARTDLVAAAQTSDDLGHGLLLLEMIATRLLRMGTDLRLLGSGPSAGFGEIAFTSLMDGSSFFSNKVNPTLIETLMQAAMQVIGKTRSGMLAVERAELDLAVFDWAAGVNLLEAMQWLAPIVELTARHAIANLGVDTKRCADLSRFEQHNKTQIQKG